MRYLPIILVSTILASCQVSSTKAVNEQKEIIEDSVPDTLVTVSNMEIDSMPFMMLKMNNETAYISMVDSVIPSEIDSTIERTFIRERPLSRQPPIYIGVHVF